MKKLWNVDIQTCGAVDKISNKKEEEGELET